ncbi:MAG TPA: DUF998 domain-containing protein [Gammaproteobacteria bacterium]|nr:DUF998 domain-containing protein [Gammaproteobacteria bacterium]
MLNRSPKIDRNKKYTYSLSGADLLDSPHAIVRETLEGAPAYEPYSLDQGLREIQHESMRSGSGLFLNGNRPVTNINGQEVSTVTEANLKKWFPNGHHENLLRHFTQSPAQSISKIVLRVAYSNPAGEFRDAILTVTASQNLDEQAEMPPEGSQGRFPTLTDFYFEDDNIYCDTLTYIQPGTFPGGQSLKKGMGGIEIFSRFRLLKPNERPEQENRYELISVGTNSKEIHDLLKGNEKALEESFHSIHSHYSQAEEKTPAKKRSSQKPVSKPWNWKAIGTGVAITLGVAAAVVGAILFPPSIAVSLPLLGTFLHVSPIALAGVGLCAATTIGIIAQQVVTSERVKEKYAKVHPAWKWAAGIVIGLGIAAAVTAAVFLPAFLIVPVFYGGLALAGLTATGHAIHIASKPVADHHKNVDPWERSSGVHSENNYLIRKKTLVSTTANVKKSMEQQAPGQSTHPSSQSSGVATVSTAPALTRGESSGNNPVVRQGSMFGRKVSIVLNQDGSIPDAVLREKLPQRKN